MGKKHKPRSGSIAYYPRKKAKSEVPRFTTFPGIEGEEAKILNFYGYKAGMTHVIGKDNHVKGRTYGNSVSVPSTVIECPPLKVFAARAYKKTTNGLKTVGEIWSDKTDKNLARKIKSMGAKKKSKKPKEGKPEKKEKIAEEKKKTSWADLEGKMEAIVDLRLLAHTQPALTGIGKKKPEIAELFLSGNVEQKMAFAKERLGKEIMIEDVFKANQFLDVKAVTTGKGMQGVIKKFGVKMHRPKAKKRRIVGCISPWTPRTVMWTVARPGQMGYHSRTEYNKKILLMEKDENINPKAGFEGYGTVRNEFLALSGSVPGPVKRLIALREPIRPVPAHRFELSEISMVASKEK